MSKDYSWILKERVTGYEDSEVRVEDGVTSGLFVVIGQDGKEARLDASGDRLLFDGEFVDVGDDFVDYLGVLDGIRDGGVSQPYNDEDPLT
jgi:hypothetical protein